MQYPWETLLSRVGDQEPAPLNKTWLFSCNWSVDHILADTTLQLAYQRLMKSKYTIWVCWINLNCPGLYATEKRFQLSYPEHENRAKIHLSCNQATCISVLALALNHSLLGLSLWFLNMWAWGWPFPALNHYGAVSIFPPKWLYNFNLFKTVLSPAKLTICPRGGPQVPVHVVGGWSSFASTGDKWTSIQPYSHHLPLLSFWVLSISNKCDSALCGNIVTDQCCLHSRSKLSLSAIWVYTSDS